MKMTTDQKIRKLQEKINKLRKEREEKILLSILQEDPNYTIIEKYFDYKGEAFFPAKINRDFSLKVDYRTNELGKIKKGFAYDGGYKLAPTFLEWLGHMKDEQNWKIPQWEYQIKQAKKFIELIETISNDIVQKKSGE